MLEYRKSIMGMLRTNRVTVRPKAGPTRARRGAPHAALAANILRNTCLAPQKASRLREAGGWGGAGADWGDGQRQDDADGAVFA